jgi:hypothetical protein
LGESDSGVMGLALMRPPVSLQNSMVTTAQLQTTMEPAQMTTAEELDSAAVLHRIKRAVVQ